MPKEPLEIFLQIQPLVQNEIRNALQEKKDDEQYAVTKIPAHTHNNVDSLPVLFSDLTTADNHSAIIYKTLTAAQIKALFTTPITLIPQPGPRAVIIVESITARLVYAGTAYAGANNLEFRYTDAAGTKVTVDMAAAFINSAASAYDQAPGITTEFAPIAGDSGTNGAIVVCVPTANPTLGNSPITFVIHYRVVPFNA